MQNDRRYDFLGFDETSLFPAVFAALFGGFVSAYIHSSRLFARECGGLRVLRSRIVLGGLRQASPGKVVKMSV